eukprot:NODE_12_length_54577_cov_0.384100.p15 type:complete len:360 gc:universal NODE_12_length_54577_cov_0.384100:39962-41041(+)
MKRNDEAFENEDIEVLFQRHFNSQEERKDTVKDDDSYREDLLQAKDWFSVLYIIATASSLFATYKLTGVNLALQLECFTTVWLICFEQMTLSSWKHTNPALIQYTIFHLINFVVICALATCVPYILNDPVAAQVYAAVMICHKFSFLIQLIQRFWNCYTPSIISYGIVCIIDMILFGISIQYPSYYFWYAASILQFLNFIYFIKEHFHNRIQYYFFADRVGDITGAYFIAFFAILTTLPLAATWVHFPFLLIFWYHFQNIGVFDNINYILWISSLYFFHISMYIFYFYIENQNWSIVLICIGMIASTSVSIYDKIQLVFRAFFALCALVYLVYPDILLIYALMFGLIGTELIYKLRIPK